MKITVHALKKAKIGRFDDPELLVSMLIEGEIYCIPIVKTEKLKMATERPM